MEDRLRLLAHWHACRREVDELVQPLLTHGPAAVDRVSARLADVQGGLDAERLAWEAFSCSAALAHRSDLGAGTGATDDPGRTGVPADGDPVDELARARSRAEQARSAHRPAVHPSVADALRLYDVDHGAAGSTGPAARSAEGTADPGAVDRGSADLGAADLGAADLGAPGTRPDSGADGPDPTLSVVSPAPDDPAPRPPVPEES